MRSWELRWQEWICIENGRHSPVYSGRVWDYDLAGACRNGAGHRGHREWMQKWATMLEGLEWMIPGWSTRGEHKPGVG